MAIWSWHIKNIAKYFENILDFPGHTNKLASEQSQN